jgi:exopolysaccharide production protein ExoQ
MRQIPRSVVGRAQAPTPQLAPPPAWVQDPTSSTGPTFLLCALLLVMILPADLNFAALIAQGQNTTSSTADDHSIANRIVWIVALVGSCWYIASRQRLWLAVMRTVNPFYLLFIAVAVLSVTWSIQPAITEQFVFRLVVIMLCCTAFTLNGWRAHRFQSVMRSLLGAFLVGSIIFALVLPQYGVQQFPDYASAIGSTFKTYGINGIVPNFKPVLRGLTFGKNQLGPLAGFGVIFWFHGWLNKETKFSWSLLCGGAALICLYWSHSSTSVLATVFAVVVMLMLRHWPKWLRRYMAPIIAVVSLVILVYSLVILKLVPQLDFLLTPITALTGKDLTFTDRTPIWQIIGAHIAQHPLLGTGYSAYWVDQPGSPAEVFKTLMYFYPGSSHNGYLDVANDLGILGSICLLGFIVTCLRQSLKVMTFDRNQGSLYLVLLFYTFWSSMTESHWFSAGSVLFTVFTVSVCAAARTLLQHRFEIDSERAPTRAAPTGRMA